MSSAHEFDDIRIARKECTTLAKNGYAISFVTPGKPGSRIPLVTVVTVPRFKTRRERFSRTLFAVYRAALKQRASIYHFHDPDLIPIGLLLKARGKKVIYDVHEDVPRQIFSKYWIPSHVRKPISLSAAFVERLGSHAFDAIIAATPSIAEHFPAKKTTVIQNFPFEGELQPAVETAYATRSNRAIYAGGISEIRGIREMLAAFERLEPETEADLSICGTFAPTSLRDEIVKAHGWKNVRYLGKVDRETLGTELGAARVGLVLFHPVPNHISAQPNKLFEYMSAGLPVIASDFPLWRDIVTKYECGILVNPLDTAAITAALKWIFAHPKEAEEMGNRGRTAIGHHLNWARESEKLLTLYSRLTT